HVSFKCTANPLDVPSFPTRRSSDLDEKRVGQSVVAAVGAAKDPVRLHLVQPLHAQAAERRPALRERLDQPRLLDVVPITSQAHIDRKSTRLNSSHSQISYAVFCLKK